MKTINLVSRISYHGRTQTASTEQPMMAAPVTGSVHKAEFEEKPEEQPQKVDSETTSLLEPNPGTRLSLLKLPRYVYFPSIQICEERTF